MNRGVLVAVVAAIAWPAVSRAELRDDAANAERALVAEGALVDRSSRFLFAGEVDVLRPLDAVPSSDACVTVLVIGARGTQFSVAHGVASTSAAAVVESSLRDGDAVEVSNEGLYVHTACGAELDALTTVAVRMRSPRGALETIVARSTTTPRALDAILVERSRGASTSDTPAFEPLPAGATDDRKRRVATRARARGATNLAAVTMQASGAGTGEFDLRVTRGCHAFDVLSDAAQADLDATLTTAGDATDAGDRTPPNRSLRLDVDDAEAPDAHLETCLPEPDDVVLRYTGAASSSAVTVFDAVFAWPKWISDRWGVRAATALARVVFAGGSGPSPTSPPILEVLGGPGTMVVHPSVEPGRCYLATVSITKGTSRGIRLTAGASSRTSIDQAPLPGDAVTVSFCAEDVERARIQVEAPSVSNAWVLSLYALGPGTEEAP